MGQERGNSNDPGRAQAPGRRQQQAEATRAQLISAARELFESSGYQATTVETITERANTAHGTFYLYFKNKEDVFGEVIGGIVDDLYANSTGVPGNPVGTETAVSIHGFLSVFAARRDLWRCLLEATLQSASVERMWVDLRQAFTNRSAETLRTLQRDGEMRPIDPMLAANALGSMVEWFAFTHFVLGEPEHEPDALDRATEVLRDLWDHAVFGALPTESTGDTAQRA